MSRLPRAQEHLKTGFTAEAVSAARCRAQAERADSEGKPNLARRWRELAEAKDALAVRMLEAAGQVRHEDRAIADALAEEEFENEVLYPKMMRDVDAATAEAMSGVVEAQREHARRLERLRLETQAAPGDISTAA
ncbi:MAG: hypothetical protein ACRD2Z_14790 [Thermoanaerobaculia bacterium]